MMAVCDHRKKITYASVRHPGTTHDSIGYNLSNLKRHMEACHNPRKPRYLISDEGVNCQKTLLTAYRRDRGEVAFNMNAIQIILTKTFLLNSVNGRAQRLFNRRLKSFRCWIEHTFGLWKKQFPIFFNALRKYKLKYSQATIISSIGKKLALKIYTVLAQIEQRRSNFRLGFFGEDFTK